MSRQKLGLTAIQYYQLALRKKNETALDRKEKTHQYLENPIIYHSERKKFSISNN
jgi:hypothetical protein